MLKTHVNGLLLLCAVSVSHHGAAAAEDLAAWVVDSMHKVFKDDTPPAEPPTEVEIDAARNEVVSGQVVVRSADVLTGLACRVEALTNEAGGRIPPPRIRYVGYVPVGSKPIGYELRPRPCDYPDPLFDAPAETTPAQTAQPIWLTFVIPADAAAGLYRGSVQIDGRANGASCTATLPIRVRVHRASLPDARTLKVSNWHWFDSPEVARWCGVEEIYGEPFWKLMEEVARNMATHRQNVIFTPTTAWTWGTRDWSTAEDLIRGRVGSGGRLEFDFSRFDRWVNLFRAAGVDALIEAHPLARRSRQDRRDGEQGYKSIVWRIEDGVAVRRQIPSISPDYDDYLSVYLPALQAHLEEQGWLTSFVQHVLDEPNGERKPTYVRLAALVRRHAPRIRIIDAVQTNDLVGSIDVWAPLITGLAKNRDFYRERQAKGEDVWLYTCLVPAGPLSLNRFVEYPLTRVRLLHWANYASGTSGYLHWAYNWWVATKDPRAGKWRLPPGDEWIVYPRVGGVDDSIRFEAMLEGIQDYELLSRLASQDREAADAICGTLVRFSRDATKGYQFDDEVPALRAMRRKLLDALSSQP